MPYKDPQARQAYNSVYLREWRARNLEKPRVCKKCDIEKNISEFTHHTKIEGKQYFRYTCKACFAAKKRWAVNDYKRNWWYLSHYNITTVQYEELLAKQNGVCAICKKPPKVGGKRLAVDHDHKCCPGKITCGKCIRGLLCRRCNYGLSWFQDDSERLLSASHYLNNGRVKDGMGADHVSRN